MVTTQEETVAINEVCAADVQLNGANQDVIT